MPTPKRSKTKTSKAKTSKAKAPKRRRGAGAGAGAGAAFGRELFTMDMALDSDQGRVNDFTLFMGCQRADERTCGYWSVAQLMTLKAKGAAAILSKSKPSEAADLVTACPASTFLSVGEACRDIILGDHTPDTIRKVRMDKGATFCKDVTRMLGAFAVDASVVCEDPEHCALFSCFHAPERLEGVQQWVVLAQGHWFAALTRTSKGGRIMKVVTIDSLHADEVAEWDRCVSVRGIMARLYTKGAKKSDA